MDAPTPASPVLASNTWYFRSMGATLGAVLGLAAMGTLYVVSVIPAVETVTYVRSFLSGDGLLGEGVLNGAAILPPWTVAPIAAALAGVVCAPRTMAGSRWAGVTMGYLTYAIAIFVAPLAVFAPPWSAANLTIGGSMDLVEMAGTVLVGLPIIALLAGIVLAPLLVVCAAAGIAWAAALRAVLRAGGASVGLPERPTTDGWFLLWTAVVVGLWWVVVAAGLLGVMSGGDIVD